MFQTDADKFAWEANLYEQLSHYYKYRDPQTYIECYSRHFEAVQKLIQYYSTTRVSPQKPMQQAKIRMLHAAPNTQSVDVYVNGQRVIQNISYKQSSDFLTLRQGQYRIDIYPSGTDSTPIFSALIPVMNNTTYTVAVVGDINMMQLLSFVDNSYLPYKAAKIRFAHLSPDTSTVDVSFKDGDMLFPNVSFKQVTEYVQVTPGTADLEVKLLGTKDVVLSLPTKIEPNKLYTIYAVGYTSRSPKLEGLFITN